MPALTVQNAEIKTATVEVRTLTISGRQMTLAVFRQLIEEALMNDDFSMNGVPWGRVNYHPTDRCRYTGHHEHVVWQKGAELRRSKVLRFFRDESGVREGDHWPAIIALPQLFIAV